MNGHCPGELVRLKAVAGAQAIWRLTELEGFDTVLKAGLRKGATEVLSGLAARSVYSGDRVGEYGERLLAAIRSLEELILFGRDVGCIGIENAGRVLITYRWLGECVPSVRTDAGAMPKAPDTVQSGESLNARQQLILAHISAVGPAQIGDLHNLFLDQEISGKTIQRDLWHLVNLGLLRRIGGKRWTTYSAIGHSMSDSAI